MLNAKTNAFLNEKLKHCLGGKAKKNNIGDHFNKRYKEEIKKRDNGKEDFHMRNINNKILQVTEECNKKLLKLESKLNNIKEHKKNITSFKTTLQKNLFNSIM